MTTEELQARVAQARELLSEALGDGHNLKAFAGTMLRWGKPGVNWQDEARRVVEHADKWHWLIGAALDALASSDSSAWLASVKAQAVADFVKQQERSVADDLLARVKAQARKEALEDLRTMVNAERDRETRLRADQVDYVLALIDSLATQPGQTGTREAPCGGSRCHQATDGTWIHSSKSYGTCAVRASEPASCPTIAPCPVCNKRPAPCGTCGGKGQVANSPWPHLQSEWEPCPTCGGKGAL